MKTILNPGVMIANYRVLSLVSCTNSEVSYKAFDTSTKSYVIIKEFYPNELHISRADTKVVVDEQDKDKFKKMSDAYKEYAKLSGEVVLLSQNNTVYTVSPQIIDDAKRDEVFAYLDDIDERYTLADSKDKSKKRMSAILEYEDIAKLYPEYFYMHTKSVDNLADAYCYNYYNDALSVNAVSKSVEEYSQNSLNKKAMCLYLQSAYRDSGYAQYRIATFYNKGYGGCLCNYQLSKQWYEQAFNNGYNTAAKHLADCYFYGKGTECQSYEKAFKYYEIAAEENSDACLKLVECYEEELGVDRDDKKIFYYLKKAYDLGVKDSDVYIQLARCYINADGTYEDYKEAYKLIKKAALRRNISGVIDLVDDVYFNKKLGFNKKFIYFMYVILSWWDYLVAGTVCVGVIVALVCLAPLLL